MAMVTSESDAESVRMKSGVLEGKYQLVFISPELLIGREKFQCMCQNEIYTERLVALVIDEAHYVKKW